MNTLPAHRQAIHARTWPTTWRAADYAGVSHFPARTAWGGRVLAGAVVLAATVVLLINIFWR